MKRHNQLARLLAIALLTLTTAPASAYDWPGLYNPTQLLTLNLDMDPDHWTAVKADTTHTIEVPAKIWADGDIDEPTPKLVSVRRKSADALGDKVSLKIDINEYVDQSWNGVKKLSLENGDDVDVVAEGFAWYLNRVAAASSASGYKPGLAAWIKLYVNGEYMGVYLNVEQRDKTFLKNRGLYTKNETWLYKASDVGTSYELKVGDPDSPTSAELCYSPFGAESAESAYITDSTDGGGKGKGKGNKGGGDTGTTSTTGTTTCKAPEGDAAVAAELDSLIDMDAMLTQGAVSAFTMGPDALFSKGKNFYFIDFAAGRRLYVPWDLDTVFVSKSPEGSIYGTSKKKGPDMTMTYSPYEELILKNETFRARYKQIMGELLAGPMQIDAQTDFLNYLESMLASALAADPNNNIDGPISERFDSLRKWVSGRVIDINKQLAD
jgi:spore coat protein CotH